MLCQIGKASDGERTTKTLAMVGRVDTNYIDLPGWVCGVVVVGGVVVRGVGVWAGVCMRFRPAEASHCSINFVNEKTVWIEPRFIESLGEYCWCPITLLGVGSKGASIERQP